MTRKQALRVPDFIIGGAPRSGTTWLSELLDRHPQVYMAKPVKPEPKFFLRDDLFEKGLEYYSRTWFESAPVDSVLGEKTTNYLESPLAAERIANTLPDVKLIFILREPCERAYSNFLWSRMNGMEKLDFAEAIRSETGREEKNRDSQLKYARPHAYFSRGLYAGLLKPFFDRFAREKILTLRFEDIRIDPDGLAVRLHRFIGVDENTPGAVGASSRGVVNPAEGNEEAIPPQVRAELIEKYRGPNQELARLLGPDFKIWDYR